MANKKTALQLRLDTKLHLELSRLADRNHMTVNGLASRVLESYLTGRLSGSIFHELSVGQPEPTKAQQTQAKPKATKAVDPDYDTSNPAIWKLDSTLLERIHDKLGDEGVAHAHKVYHHLRYEQNTTHQEAEESVIAQTLDADIDD